MGVVVLMIVLGFLFGGMLLALVFGYQSMEEQRAAQAATSVDARPWASDEKRFFAHVETSAPDPLETERARLVKQLEELLSRENQLAAEFVNEPSFDRLYPNYAAYAAAAVRQMELHVGRESLKAAGFAASPSLEGLFTEMLPLAGLPAGPGARRVGAAELTVN